MKAKLTKTVTILLIFLLCINIHGLIPLFMGSKNTDLILDQNVSFLNTNRVDPMTLKVGMYNSPPTIDPVDCWDTSSSDVIEQVVETLFTYDLNNPELPQINQLAESYWWEDLITLHITLRQGILFHDNTPFNAAAAKWNIDRLLYLTNCTGTNFGQVASARTLWLFPDEATPIISSVSITGEWDLVITLNDPYAPLLHLLSYINAGMLSPNSTPPTDFIDTYSGQLVGTGPFRYEYYDPDIEVKFTRWDNYWKTPAYFEEMQFVIYYDYITALNAMLAYQIDILDNVRTEDIPLYEADPNITVKKFTEDTGKPGLAYFYLGFNNQKYNQTWRKAMSHAINYSYILEVLREDDAVRANSPISPGFGGAFNESVSAANFDIAKARSVMQSMGFGVGFTTDQEWIDQANISPFLAVPYTYNVGNQFREELMVAIHEWFQLIGIFVVDDGVTWADFLNYLFDDHDHLGIFSIGWGPDFPEPYNMLYPLIGAASMTNSGQINDPWVDAKIAVALNTTDETARYNIYKDIQWYMAEVGYFHAPLYHSKINYVHLREIQGVPYNSLNSFYAYPIYRATPGIFSLSTDAGNPDDDGDFTLTWNLATGADNYSVYQYSSYIAELNESLTLLAEEITDFSLLLSGYTDGSYYFIVSAINEYGYTLSNCINVVVQITDDHDLEVHLDIPSDIEIDTSYIITATVQNIGLNDEIDVQLFLYLDAVVVGSLSIPYLPAGDSNFILYEWTPTEYKTYYFEVYAPPVAGEISINDNLITVDIPLIDTQLFDGLYIEHIFNNMGYNFNSSFTYTPFQDGLFYETFNLEGMYTYQWVVDPLTRLMSGGSVFGDGFYTPAWIFTDVSLGDTIPIAVDGEGNHDFNVSREFIYDLPGFGPIGIWELEDITLPGGIAWYEKSTGLLLYGTFYYYLGTYNYTLDFVDTNAQFKLCALPEPFILSSDAGDPDKNGAFNLEWNESNKADDYSVYESSNFISEITGDLILLASEIIDLNLALEGYSDGTYYFIVVAHNEYGDTLSNCIQIEVDIKVPPTLIYDTIPDEVMMTYTRTSQIIGSFKAFCESEIISVEWIGEPDPGFALFNTFSKNGDIYLSETTIMTTNQLEAGIHFLQLRIWDVDGDFYDKIFTVIVYRQAELNLRGEFDYLLKEEVKISIVAQSFDVEEQFPLNPITVQGMTVFIRIVDYNGDVKVEGTMTYNPDGFFHWDSVETIKQLKNDFPKGIYIVQAWIEFDPESYYIGGSDVIQFHIDPPAEDEVDPLFFLGVFGFSGLVGVNLALAILLKRKHRTK